MGTFLKKHKVKLIWAAIILAVLTYVLVQRGKEAAKLPVVASSAVQQSDLVNSVSITGTVESETSKKVFSRQALPVKANLVEVGDKVKAGDVLCELDTSSIEKSLSQQRAAAGATAAQHNDRIALSEKQYATAKADLESDLNATIIQAEQALARSKQQLEQAEIAYDGTIDSLQNGREDARYSGLDNSNTMTDPLVNARDRAYASYESAKQAVTDAENLLTVTKNGVTQQLDSYEDSVRSSRIAASSNNASLVGISNMEDDLADAVVIAPVDGIVTAVYVTEGANSGTSNLLYVIEDTSKLKVTVALKEYDLSLVGESDIAEIKSDVTGEEIFTGKVTTIAPTTTKTQLGDNLSGKTGEFTTEIGVDDTNSALRVGTKARVEIIYEKKTDVLNVTHDAVGVDEQGNPVVFLLEEKSENVYVLKAVPVTLGMETDFYVEITGTSLKAGDLIVPDATGMTEGLEVSLVAAPAGAGDPAATGAAPDGTVMISRKG